MRWVTPRGIKFRKAWDAGFEFSVSHSRVGNGWYGTIQVWRTIFHWWFGNYWWK